MLNEDSQSSDVRSASPPKRAEDGNGETRASKRRKVDQSDHPNGTRELAPKTSNGVDEVSTTHPPQPNYAKPKTKTSSNKRRVTSLNLKNYPGHHHPVGIGIWILQKVEQARKELENQRLARTSSDPPRDESQVELPTAGSLSGYAGPSSSDHVNVPPGQEQEAERLQAQRNRKTKQRQENWAKNKETDVVARAKIESKRYFDALPDATDAEQQAWIEEKIRLDFGRLLDRLAAQLNSEIVGISLYQIGYADHHFNKATNPDMAGVDEETLSAARMIAYVLPALSESVVSHQHQNAAYALVHALAQGSPPQDSFIAAIFMLAQDSQVLSGLDKLLSNIFLPKTGSQLSQLAQKRASNGSDQSGSGNGVNHPSSALAGAPVWHWKEPATIANSVRYSSYPVRAPTSGNGGFTNTVMQPYYQDPLPPPILVTAEIYRPPRPPPGYYLQPHIPHHPQGYYQNGYYPGQPPYLAPPSNWMNQGNHGGRSQGNWSTPQAYDAHARSYPQPLDAHGQSYQQPSHQIPTNAYAGSYRQPNYQPPPNASGVSHQYTSEGHHRSHQEPLDDPDAGPPHETDDRGYQQLLDDVEGFILPDGESVSRALSSRDNSNPIENIKASEARTPSEPPMAALPLAKDRAMNEGILTQPSYSSDHTTNEPRTDIPNCHSASSPEVVVISSLASDGGLRKPSPLVRNRSKHIVETNEFPNIPEKTVVVSDPAPEESLRRRSSRGTVLTSKAKAAGILLGTQVKDPIETNSRRLSKPPRTRLTSTSPEASDELLLTASTDPSWSVSSPELTKPTATDSNDVVSKEPQEVATGFVPRSSGRERKPTAKILASSSFRSGLKVSDYSSSVPRVSSKLRLSLSSQNSELSENSLGSKSTPDDKISTSASKIQTSPEVLEALAASNSGHASLISNVSTQIDSLGQPTTPELERRHHSNNERRTSIDKRGTDLDNLRQATFFDEQDGSPDEHILRPLIGRNKASNAVLPVNVSPIMYERFLTNDKGQGMGQALLIMAQVAAEWSDSDDEDEPASEDEFHAKLRQAVDKQMQQIKPKAASAAQIQVPQKKSSTLTQPGTGIHPTILRTAGNHTSPSSNPSTGARSNNAPPNGLPVVLPNSGPQNGARHASADPRSISQITDDFIALIRLKDEAKVHGLPINDWMNLDELTNLVDAYHAGKLDIAIKSGMGASGSSPAHPATREGATVNTAQETRAARANQKQRNAVPDEIVPGGSTNGSRHSTPSSRGVDSATPQPRIQTPPIPTFKRGGTVMNFGFKAKRASAATST